MSDAATGPAGRSPDPVAAAERAMLAARESVAALITARAQAAQEARRLRERSATPGLGELEEQAAVHDARVAELEPRIVELRDLAHRAEVAYEALRTGASDPAPGA